MASLLGKADPTLVTAAARAGLANVPGDYSKQFGIMADASKDIFTGIEEAFKKYETGLKADKLKLDTAISELQKYGAGMMQILKSFRVKWTTSTIYIKRMVVLKMIVEDLMSGKDKIIKS